MSRSRIIIIVIILGIFAAAALAYAFLRPTEEASAPIEAIPISQSDQGSAVVSSESAAEAEDSAPAEEDSAGEESQPSAGETEEQEAGAGGAEEEAPADSEGEGQEAPSSDAASTESDNSASENSASESTAPVLFQISQAESEARFSIDEILRGSPKTVIGITDQVAGEILFDPGDPSSAQVGIILVNARTLATDDDRRNRAIGNQILDTASYEYISFEPTAVSGLPETISPGDTVNFQITGDLTIRDVTKEVTFEAAVTFVSAERLEGSAAAVIIKEDFGLTIPDVPFVANVSEEVGLEIDFVALPVS